MPAALRRGLRGLLAWLRSSGEAPRFAELLDRSLEEGDRVALRIGAVELSLSTGAPLRGRGN